MNSRHMNLNGKAKVIKLVEEARRAYLCHLGETKVF